MKTVRLATVIGEDEDYDKIFYDYLEVYGISHRVVKESDKSNKYPEIEYTGNETEIKHMLTEKFGFSREDFESLYPDLL
jgi:hypothetical protein